MRLALYMRPCQTATRFAGIGRYIADLADQMIVAAVARGDQVIAVVDDDLPHAHLTQRWPQVHFVHVQMDLVDCAAQCIVDQALLAMQPDVIVITHLFDDYADRWLHSESPARRALIHYDLIPQVFPDRYLPTQQMADDYQGRLDLMRGVDWIWSISDYTNQDLLARMPELSATCLSIGSATEGAMFAPTQSVTAEDYLLYAPSGFDYRKNVDGLIEAYAELPSAIRAQYPLWLVGRIKDHDRSRLQGLIDRLGVRVKLLGFVPDDQLIQLYQRARLFVFPSFYEGFGLPALEAMHAGCPVIAANLTSLPEVLGDGDGLFDPHSKGDFVNALQRGLTDVVYREHLIAQQSAHARTFTWERVAERALASLGQIESTPMQAYRALSIDPKILRDFALNPSDLKRCISALADIDRQIRPLHWDDTADQRLPWCIEGSLEGSYSLSYLNRETARSLKAQGHDVSVRQNYGEFSQPTQPSFAQEQPDIAVLERPDPATLGVVSRNLYPPLVSDAKGQLNTLHHYAWEEAGFPLQWVADFNQHLDAVSFLSPHVEKVLIDHGLSIPSVTSGCGVDLKLKPIGKRSSDGVFRFLHVSSCFPRKGVDVLLKAYFMAFNQFDAVELLIKTFDNPHNTVAQQLQTLQEQYPNGPTVRIVSADLSQDELASLYHQSDVMVAPSRAEGFGLPMAEAALQGIPVITTAWGGQRVFADSDNAWLIDYCFADADSHLSTGLSYWAEPDAQHLCDLMQQSMAVSSDERDAMAMRMAERVKHLGHWDQVTMRHQRLIENLKTQRNVRPQIGWISTWGEQCGIGVYTQQLCASMPGPMPIKLSRQPVAGQIAVWGQPETTNLNALRAAIQEHNLDVVVFQLVYPFFEFSALADLVGELQEQQRVVVIELHESQKTPGNPAGLAQPSLKAALQQADRVIVHSIEGLNDAREAGLVDNVMCLPLGVPQFDASSIPTDPGIAQAVERLTRLRNQGGPIIASYGFFLPHKGLLELIQSLEHWPAKQPRPHLLLLNAEYPDPVSEQAIAQARAYIQTQGLQDHVTLITDFLAVADCAKLLQMADLVVFPYRQTEQGASSAVRFALGCRRPIATTNLPIFGPLDSLRYPLSDPSAQGMAISLAQCLNEIAQASPKAMQRKEQTQSWIRQHSFERLAKQFYEMTTALIRKRRYPMEIQ